MHRRSFLGALAAALAGAAFDPEKLLWVPGQKTIFLPPVQGWMRSGIGWHFWETPRPLIDPNGEFLFFTYSVGTHQLYIVENHGRLAADRTVTALV